MKIEFKKFDYIILGTIIVICLLLAGIFLTKTKISKTPVTSEDTVIFQVFFRGITTTTPENVFLPMEESFITIRNVPHKKVTILDSIQHPRQTTILDPKGRPIAIDDVSTPFMNDCLVTLFDDAKITDDGVVMGGNKLKIGLPITLEGKKYRFSGIVSNVEILSKEDATKLKEMVEKEKERLANPQPISPLELMGPEFDIRK